MVNWDIVPLHISLLPSGKVIGWGKFEDGGGMGTMATIPRLWDPASGNPPTSAVQVPADTMLFCSGHTQMADGRLMVSGGHKQDDVGIDNTNIFDWQSESWVPGLPKMAHGRWYPTVTTLPDGRMLTMAGRDSSGQVVTTPEIWESNQWVELPGAGSLEIPYYPRNFVPPTGSPGRIFMAGERVRSRWFDVDGNTANGRGQWTNGPTRIYPFTRDYGTAVMYEPGKILYAGGGGNMNWQQSPDAKDNVPTATAEKIDLTAASPAWSSAGSMQFRRRHLNSTILPDGQVLITGGTTGGGFVDIAPGDAARAAELWNPTTNGWTTLAANSVMRVYHSVSLLLPDATVLHGASGNAFVGPVPMPDEKNHEIFSPPYLFKGARPTITGLSSSSVSYGGTFTVTTPNAAQITDGAMDPHRVGHPRVRRRTAGGHAKLHSDGNRCGRHGRRQRPAQSTGTLPGLHSEPERGAVRGEDRTGPLAETAGGTGAVAAELSGGRDPVSCGAPSATSHRSRTG